MDTTQRHDFLTAYVDDLANVIDFDPLQNSTLKLAVDPLGGAGVYYWPRIIDQYNLGCELLNPYVDPTFRFMTCDWDKKIRMDCSSPNAMARMISKASRTSLTVAWACDTDHDRHGIVTRSSGLLNPNHYLAVCQPVPVPRTVLNGTQGRHRQDARLVQHDRPRREGSQPARCWKCR